MCGAQASLFAWLCFSCCTLLTRFCLFALLITPDSQMGCCQMTLAEHTAETEKKHQTNTVSEDWYYSIAHVLLVVY